MNNTPSNPAIGIRDSSAGIGVEAVSRAQSAVSASYAWELLKWPFSFPAMLGMLLAGRMFYEGRKFFLDPDAWWHIKAGQAILATHLFPVTDTYSFTGHGQPWIAYEWLGEVVTGWLANMGGLLALDFYLIALGSAILIALYYLGTLRSCNSKAGFVAAALVASWALSSFTLRPQMLGNLFLVLTLICLELFRQGQRKALWFVPVMMLAWVNTHGSFIIGLGVIFLCWISGLVEFDKGGVRAERWSPRQQREISLAFLLCLAVLPFTPYGTRLAVYPFDLAFSQPLVVTQIGEWQSLPFNMLGGKLFLAFIFGFFLAQMLFKFQWRLDEMALFIGSAAMTAIHVRFIMFFVPFSVPLFACIAARWIGPYSRAKDKYVLNAILIVAVLLAMVHYSPSQKYLEDRVAQRFPVQAVAYMREHAITGPLYNNYFFGGYLIWSGYRTFIDGRADVFERGGVFSDYLYIIDLKPGALSVLQGYGVRACLLERGEPLSTLLAASPDWKRVYADNVSELYVPKGSSNSSPRK